jgi:hypothetical protein
LSGVELTPVTTPTVPRPGETGETPKKQLTILVDPKNNISINGRAMSLNRDMQIAGKVGAEAEGRKLRVDVIRFMANNPGVGFRASEIWPSIRPNESEFNRQLWNQYCKDFFRYEFKHNRTPIITVNQVRPKLLHYSLDSFELIVGDTDKELKVKDESIFTLPNGVEVGGKGGKLLHMLARASKDQPVIEEAVSNKLYSHDELRRRGGTRGILSALVSSVRQDTKGTSLEIIKVLTNQKDPDSKRKYPGYYMIEKPVDAATAAQIETEAEQQSREPLSLHEATVLAAFLTHHNTHLAAEGLEALPFDVFEALNRQAVETYSNGEKTREDLHRLRSVAFKKAMALLSDKAKLEEVVQSYEKEKDPRTDLLIHLLSYGTETQQAAINQLLDSHPELEVTFDAGRRRGYQVVNVSSQQVIN